MAQIWIFQNSYWLCAHLNMLQTVSNVCGDLQLPPWVIPHIPTHCTPYLHCSGYCTPRQHQVAIVTVSRHCYCVMPLLLCHATVTVSRHCQHSCQSPLLLRCEPLCLSIGVWMPLLYLPLDRTLVHMYTNTCITLHCMHLVRVGWRGWRRFMFDCSSLFGLPGGMGSYVVWNYTPPCPSQDVCTWDRWCSPHTWGHILLLCVD